MTDDWKHQQIGLGVERCPDDMDPRRTGDTKEIAAIAIKLRIDGRKVAEEVRRFVRRRGSN